MAELFTPPNHQRFKALKICGAIDPSIQDCAIAYIEPSGGGPSPDHCHAHDHIFVVISGEITIRTGNSLEQAKSGESIYVSGLVPHSVWNNSNIDARVIGISITPPLT